MNDFEKTQKLIKLKRYEQPPEGYLEGFLDEFHQRQRAELMKRSSRSLFFERLSTYLSGFGTSKLMFAGGAVAAVALAFLVVDPRPTSPLPSNSGATAGIPVGFDDPRGQVTPVSTDPVTEEIDRLEQRIEGVNDEARALRFRLEPRAAVNAETQTVEL